MQTYLMESNGPSWILLRGWGRESRHWGTFPNKLEIALQKNVTCVDLPGSGSRIAENSPLTIHSQVNSLRKITKKLTANNPPGQKIYILAISLGSMIATDWALRFPDEISGVVLINPSFKGLSPWHYRLRPRSIPTLIKAVFESDFAKSEMHVLSQVSNLKSIHLETSKTWAEIRESRPISKINFLRQLLAALSATVSKQEFFKVPSLILGSQRDRLVNSSRCSADAAQALRSELKFHPTAGHDLPLDDPDWLIEQIKIWLNDKTGPNATLTKS